MSPNRTVALPTQHYLPKRKDQIAYLAPGPSEVSGSLWGTNIYPVTAFLLGVAVTLMGVALALLIYTAVIAGLT